MLIRTMVAAAALFLVPGCAEARQPDTDFGTEMRKRLAERMVGASISADPADPLSAVVKGGEWDEATVNFHRVHSYCQSANADDCEALKKEFIEKITKKPPAVSKASLRLIVRDAQYVGYVRATEKSDSLAHFEQIGDDLFVLLASDSPDAIALVGDKGLKDLGLSRDEAWTIAASQTRALLPALPTSAQLKSNPVAYQDYELLGSLLIDRAAWADLAKAVGPDLFVTVVSDQFVFVAAMPDGPRLDAFKKSVAEDCGGQTRCISPNVYRFRDGRWVISRYARSTNVNRDGIARTHGGGAINGLAR